MNSGAIGSAIVNSNSEWVPIFSTPQRGCQSAPRHRDADDIVLGDRPAGPAIQVGLLFLRRHIQRGNLFRQDRHHFDRHRNRPSKPTEPGEPSAVEDDEPDLALRSAYDLADAAERNIVIVQDRQADQVANPDLLRQGRYFGLRCFLLIFSGAGSAAAPSKATVKPCLVPSSAASGAPPPIAGAVIATTAARMRGLISSVASIVHVISNRRLG